MPNIIKVFDAMALHTNDDDWVVEQITVPESINNPYGMYSVLPNSAFTKRQGVMFSEFWRNMKTSSSTESVLELRNGDKLRGYIIICRLTNDQTSEVNLFKVDINATKSDI